MVLNELGSSRRLIQMVGTAKEKASAVVEVGMVEDGGGREGRAGCCWSDVHLLIPKSRV